jgi:hypothetical protein
MAALGVHFALTDQLADLINQLAEAEEVADLMDDHFEDLTSGGWTLESGKGWDPIHRCLTGGTMRYGEGPESLCILGSGLIWGSDDWIVNFLDPDEVREVATYLGGLGEADLRQGYACIDHHDYLFIKNEEDFQQTWRLFQELRVFYKRAAESGRWMVFLADQ